MASRPEPTTSTTSCWQCETSAANVVPTLLWSSAMSMRIRDLQNFSCQERRRVLADMLEKFSRWHEGGSFGKSKAFQSKNGASRASDKDGACREGSGERNGS